jgi:hypothetical protein
MTTEPTRPSTSTNVSEKGDLALALESAIRHLEEAALVDGAQVAARRGLCIQTCATLHRSYVNSVCERYSAIADGDKPERTKCVSMSLTLAQQCRGSCREWAPISFADNHCVTCFQMLIVCSISQHHLIVKTVTCHTRCTRRTALQRMQTVRPTVADKRLPHLQRLMQMRRSPSKDPRL